MIFSREVVRWPSGRVRDEYPLMLGRRLGDFWLALSLIALFVNFWWAYSLLWALTHD